MKACVVDASVGAKWFFNEELNEQSRSLISRLEKREIDLIVPEIFYVELANVFRKRVQRKEITAPDAIRAFDLLSSFSLKRYSDHELSDVALENAIQLGISVYDAIYISLAEIYVTPLVTADNELIKACKGRFDFLLPLWELT